MEVEAVRPAFSGSYECLCHEAGLPQFLLPLRAPMSADVVRGLLKPRFERAIGAIYRPKTELESHYFQAILPRQFDEYIWFDETKAITPLSTERLEGLPDAYPFGL
jgi:erythromycin esterase-like protein